MPLALRAHAPALLLALDNLCGNILPANIVQILGVFGIGHRHDVRHEGVEEPLLLFVAPDLLVVVGDIPKLRTGLDGQLDALVPQHLPALALVDFGVDIQGGEQGVKRRRRGMHHECFVEALVLDVALLAADMAVFLVNLRGL